jgi:protein-S-isoprenylcysteine O-methyltransferase Ste14
VNTIQNKIYSKANRPLKESKKWLGAIIAVICVMLVYFSSVAILAFGSPNISEHIVSLSNVTITFLGMVFSSLILGVSAVDWKSMQTISSIHNTEVENRSYTEKVEHDIMIQYKEDVTTEDDADAPAIKPYTVITDQ